MDFPVNPAVGMTVDNGINTWTWNGKHWDIGVSVPTVPQVDYVAPNGGNIVFQFRKGYP